jgi:hypothetical protein
LKGVLSFVDSDNVSKNHNTQQTFYLADALLAYQDAASQPFNVTMTNVDLGGLTLTRGVYKWDAAAALSSGDLYLDAEGDEDAVWIFQIGTSLNIASGSSIFFTSGLGNQDNVFWQVGSSATINTYVAFIGDIVAYSSISVATASTVDGHLVGLNGAVTLDTNVVTVTSYPNKSSSVGMAGATIGAIVGSIAALMVMSAGAFMYMKNKNAAATSSDEIDNGTSKKNAYEAQQQLSRQFDSMNEKA